MKKLLQKIIAVVGPTASGKTNIAVELAQELNGEIISADSRYVYEDFNIGCAKPTPKEQCNIPHHLIDIQNPQNQYTVGEYVKDAEIIIQDLFQKEKTPIIAGGTGFYIQALLEGLDMPSVEPNMKYREDLRQLEQEKGKEYLHEMLKKVDEKSAKKLHPNDTFRIIRALEVYKSLGKPMSEAAGKKKNKYDVIYIGLNAQNRDYLYGRINKRVDIMLELGLVNEVQSLIKKYGKTLPLLKTLGYKEICEYLDNNLSLEEASELLKKNTRNFAKRQLTWFRKNKDINWFYIDEYSAGAQEEIKEQVLRLING